MFTTVYSTVYSPVFQTAALALGGEQGSVLGTADWTGHYHTRRWIQKVKGYNFDLMILSCTKVLDWTGIILSKIGGMDEVFTGLSRLL